MEEKNQIPKDENLNDKANDLLKQLRAVMNQDVEDVPSASDSEAVKGPVADTTEIAEPVETESVEPEIEETEATETVEESLVEEEITEPTAEDTAESVETEIAESTKTVDVSAVVEAEVTDTADEPVVEEEPIETIESAESTESMEKSGSKERDNTATPKVTGPRLRFDLTTMTFVPMDGESTKKEQPSETGADTSLADAENHESSSTEQQPLSEEKAPENTEKTLGEDDADAMMASTISGPGSWKVSPQGPADNHPGKTIIVAGANAKQGDESSTSTQDTQTEVKDDATEAESTEENKENKKADKGGKGKNRPDLSVIFAEYVSAKVLKRLTQNQPIEEVTFVAPDEAFAGISSLEDLTPHTEKPADNGEVVPDTQETSDEDQEEKAPEEAPKFDPDAPVSYAQPTAYNPLDFNLRDADEDIEVKDNALLRKAPKETQEVFKGLLNSMRAKRMQSTTEESLPQNAKDLSRDDVALLLKLGYEKEVAALCGSKTIEEMKRNTGEDSSVWPGEPEPYHGPDYDGSLSKKDKENRAVLTEKYRHLTIMSLIRLIATSLITVGLALYDCVSTLPYPFSAFLNREESPFIYALFGLIFVAIAIALSAKTMWHGLKQLFRLSPSAASVPVLVTLAVVVYDLLLLVRPTGNYLLQVGSLAAYSVLALTVRDAFNLRVEVMAFHLFGEEHTKYAVEPLYSHVLATGTSGAKDGKNTLWHVRQIESLRYCRARFHQSEQHDPGLIIFLPIVLAVSILFGAVCVVTETADFTSAVVALMTLLPISLLMYQAYPWYKVEKELIKHKSVILGRDMPGLYAGKSTLVFDDTQILKSQKFTEITVKGVSDYKMVMSRVKKMFEMLGGTLYPVVEHSHVQKSGESCRIIKIAPAGVEALFDGHVRALVGSASFMASNGIKVPQEDDARLKRSRSDTTLMYVAMDRELKTIFEVEYGIFNSFLDHAVGMEDYQLHFGILTYDPMLNDQYMKSRFGDREMTTHVFKPRRFAELPLPSVSSTGIVSCGNVMDTIKALVACNALEKTRRWGRIIRYVSLGVGVFLLFNLYLFFPSLLKSWLPIAIIGGHLAATIPAFVMEKTNFIHEEIQDEPTLEGLPDYQNTTAKKHSI